MCRCALYFDGPGFNSTSLLLPCRPSYTVIEANCLSKLATFMLTPKIGHAKLCLYYCYLICHKCHYLYIFGQVHHVNVRCCQLFGHVHQIRSYSFGHLDLVKWITLVTHYNKLFFKSIYYYLLAKPVVAHHDTFLHLLKQHLWLWLSVKKNFDVGGFLFGNF